MIEFGFIFWVGLAIAAGVIAGSKGRSGFGYFILGLLLPIIGVVIALGVSDQRQHVNAAGRPIRGNDLVICPACRRPKRADAKTCPHCGADAVQAAHAHEKKCPACAEWVLKEAKKCKHCGEALA